MKKAQLYLAADSGGSKTLWVLMDAEGNEIVRCRTKGLASVKEGEPQVALSVREAAELMGSYAPPKRIFLSLGGPNVEEVRLLLQRFFGSTSVCVEREARGDAILAAAKHLGCSAVVMCGTGSVAVGNTANGRKYAGGWGPVYGDGGSGGGLGSEALKLFLRSLDGHPFTEGMKELFLFLGKDSQGEDFESRMELKAKALNTSRRDLAALAPKIYRLAEEGDPVAIALYESAAKEIAALALRVSEDRLESSVVLCGGFFIQKPLLLALCQKHFSEKSKARLLYEPLFSPLLAAKLAVLKEAGIGMESETFHKFLNEEKEHRHE